MADYYLMGMASPVVDGSLEFIKEPRILVVVPVSGTLTRAFVKGDLVDNAGLGYGILRLKKGSGSVFPTPAEMFHLPEGTDQMDLKTGLSVAVVAGDELSISRASDCEVDETLGEVFKIET